MKAEFNIKRELKNELAYGIVRSSDIRVDIHFHSHIEIYFVLSGDVEVLINNRKRVLKRGEGSISFSYDAHGYRFLGHGEAFYCIIPRSWCSDILPMLDMEQNTAQFIDNKRAFEKILPAIEHLGERQNDLAVRGYVYVILGAVLDALKPAESPDCSKGTFSPEILLYVSQHFKDEISLVSIAKKFGYNSSYLSRNFRSNFGIPFCKYVTMLRLREAVMLISKGESSITKCAIDSGFGSMRSFYRAFNDEFGISPKEYFIKEHSKS